SRNAEPPGNRYGVALGRPDLLWRNEHIEGPHLLAAPVVLGPPYAIFWNRVQEPEPVGIRRAVPVPVEARMIGQYLDTRPDDEEHEEHVEKVLDPQPQREAALDRHC